MKPRAWIECEDPGEKFPLLMSAYVVKEGDSIRYRASGFGKFRCHIWGLLHGYGWLPFRS